MRRTILTTLVAVCLAGGVIQPLQAESSRTISRSAARSAAIGIALRTAEQIAGGQYPQQTLEDLRGELLNLADSVQEFAALSPTGLVDTTSLEQARGQILQMSSQELNALRKAIDPSKLHARLLEARSAVAAYSKAKSDPSASAGPMSTKTDPFPSVAGACTSSNGTDVTRIPVGGLIAADVIYFVAEAVYELAQDA